MICKDAGHQGFYAGILLIVTHKTSSFTYWNFDSSLIGHKVFHAGYLLILVLDKTRVFQVGMLMI